MDSFVASRPRVGRANVAGRRLRRVVLLTRRVIILAISFAITWIFIFNVFVIGFSVIVCSECKSISLRNPTFEPT